MVIIAFDCKELNVFPTKLCKCCSVYSTERTIAKSGSKVYKINAMGSHFKKRSHDFLMVTGDVKKLSIHVTGHVIKA